MSEKPEFLNLFAWLSKKKTKIGYAYVNDQGVMKIKADGHYDAMKLGRALMNGGIQIEQRNNQYNKPKQVEDSYSSAADEYEQTG